MMEDPSVEDVLEEARRTYSYCPGTGIIRRKLYRGIPSKRHRIAGYMNGSGYLQINVCGKRYMAHRVAWLMVHGRWPSDQLDHINHCKSDNRLANLREVDCSTNLRNQPRKATNKSGVTGVCWHNVAKKWVAQITANGKVIYLGVYDDINDAIAAREAANTEYGYHSNHGAA